MLDHLYQMSLLPLVLTLACFLVGLQLQKKLKSPLCSPILVAVIMIVIFVKATGYATENYQAGTKVITWLLTPATVCLGLPLYEQLKVLKKNLPAILCGILAGTLTSLAVVLGLCHLMDADRIITVSLLPKSITTAFGIVLSGQNGGIEALTTSVIIITGVIGALVGSLLCKLFRFKHPIAQGVAFGTASHVMGTARANEISPLTGAVSSLSLACAGIMTAVLFPIAMEFLPK